MADSTAPTVEATRARRRAMVSSYLGTTVEFYDFLLYGTAAALVFPALFFSSTDPMIGTLAAFGTLAVGYFARPIGGVIFGHFGDRLGRKKMLVLTLVIMGSVSFLIGLLPSDQQIGVWAPILLVTLRLIQGIAVGGEWAGAALMSMEHAKPRSRGFAASIVASGGPSGAVLATLVLVPFSLLPEDQFLAWGWRVPFLLSAVLVIIGLVLRLKVTETPEFAAAQARAASQPKPKAPLLAVFRHNPLSVLSGLLGGLAPLFMQSILATFVLTYAVNVGGYPRAEALWLVTIANAIHIFTIPAFAVLSDRVGRRPVMIVGAIAGAILIWPLFALVGMGTWWSLLAAFIIGNPIIQATMYGPMGAWIGEKFAADVRYTGTAVTYQLATTFGAGLAPLIATSLLAAAGGTDPSLIAWFFVALCVVSGLAFLLSKETHNKELALRTGAPADADDAAVSEFESPDEAEVLGIAGSTR
ncbi:MFS transporter [Microbacterium sediminicola]|uniref:MFS transporter n=1 Tax=Microbacterium sediminicola TaxID=415210 RepID=A0ABN2I7C4_9MICO